MTEANTRAHRSHSYTRPFATTAIAILGRVSQLTATSSTTGADHSPGSGGPAGYPDCAETRREPSQGGALETAISRSRLRRTDPRCNPSGPTSYRGPRGNHSHNHTAKTLPGYPLEHA